MIVRHVLEYTFFCLLVICAIGVAEWYFVEVTAPPVLTVDFFSLVGADVHVDRTIVGFSWDAQTEEFQSTSAIMDWTVTIVPMIGTHPSCKTQTGPELHMGWSEYEASERNSNVMHLDVWVGDEGCFDRLSEAPGEYRQYVTWTPRTGDNPVTFTSIITIGEQE